ncbi:hypothetical protein B4135_2738 [Caldibacillus debilis]|uniref:Uncharacterized protein n=1 Tax=Caldibacillus debilis TaxID=301148 RepID=A0A150LSD2_9BACI|nr:hypothetical protein B4135_2738 [Caldibacillus debilis]
MLRSDIKYSDDIIRQKKGNNVVSARSVSNFYSTKQSPR